MQTPQTIAQMLVNEHPVAVILGAFTGLAGILIAALKMLANVFLGSIAKLEAKVEGFTKSLADHGTDDDRRFDTMADNATQRHEALMGTIRDHADNVTAILTPLQVTVGVMEENMTGLRTDVKGLMDREPRRGNTLP
jgi:ABC-type uncharacterized transport system substrate-binding protein